MKLQYLFGCILAAGSLAVLPDIGVAHGGEGGGHGGGHGLGGGGFSGGHSFGGGGGGHAFVGGGHGFGGGHAFGGFTGRGFSPGSSGTRGFSTGRSSGHGDHGRFGDRGFRGRDRDFRGLQLGQLFPAEARTTDGQSNKGRSWEFAEPDNTSSRK